VLVAFVAAVLMGVLGDLGAAQSYFLAFINLNVLLAVFNLIPLPPLDGFGFIYGLAPNQLKVALAPVYSLGPLLLLALFFLPQLRPFLNEFMGAGLGLILPPLEVACQCNLLG